MSVSLSLPSMHHKKSMLPCLQLGSTFYFSSTHSATPIHGRLLTKTELLPWAFKQDGHLFKEGV